MLKEFISRTIQFERDRVGTDGSLWDHNTHEHIIDRIADESREFLVAETPEDQLLEAADIIIFTFNLLGHLAVDHGVPLEQIVDIIEAKLDHNEIKYDPANFIGKTVEEGLQSSRDLWEKV